MTHKEWNDDRIEKLEQRVDNILERLERLEIRMESCVTRYVGITEMQSMAHHSIGDSFGNIERRLRALEEQTDVE